MTPTNRLAISGFAATAIAFGPARMGFGLFLPEFRSAFDLSSTTAGLIASAGFLAFLAALPFAALLVSRLGPRVPVVLGSCAATAGFLVVSVAPNPLLLTLGVALAGSSAGLCWAPFNDATERVASEDARSSILSIIATGTSLGVAGAALLALAVTYEALPWSAAWVVFALAASFTAIGAMLSVPAGSEGRTARRTRLQALRELAARSAAPLYGAAFCFGATNAIYISFAADRIVAAGGLTGVPEAAAAAVIFISYGLFGLLGLATGRVEAGIGLGWLLRTIFLAAALSMGLIALAPTLWSAVVVSSGLHGAALMAVSAVFSFWSLRLFPGRGTRGFTAALVALAIGSVLGPAIAGRLTDQVGSEAMFLIAGVPALATAFWPRAWPETRAWSGRGRTAAAAG